MLFDMVWLAFATNGLWHLKSQAGSQSTQRQCGQCRFSVVTKGGGQDSRHPFVTWILMKVLQPWFFQGEEANQKNKRSLRFHYFFNQQVTATNALKRSIKDNKSKNEGILKPTLMHGCQFQSAYVPQKHAQGFWNKTNANSYRNQIYKTHGT